MGCVYGLCLCTQVILSAYGPVTVQAYRAISCAQPFKDDDMRLLRAHPGYDCEDLGCVNRTYNSKSKTNLVLVAKTLFVWTLPFAPATSITHLYNIILDYYFIYIMGAAKKSRVS